MHETLIFLEKVGTFCPEKRGESEMWEVHHWFWGIHAPAHPYNRNRNFEISKAPKQHSRGVTIAGDLAPSLGRTEKIFRRPNFRMTF